MNVRLRCLERVLIGTSPRSISVTFGTSPRAALATPSTEIRNGLVVPSWAISSVATFGPARRREDEIDAATLLQPERVSDAGIGADYARKSAASGPLKLNPCDSTTTRPALSMKTPSRILTSHGHRAERHQRRARSKEQLQRSDTRQPNWRGRLRAVGRDRERERCRAFAHRSEHHIDLILLARRDSRWQGSIQPETCTAQRGEETISGTCPTLRTETEQTHSAFPVQPSKLRCRGRKLGLRTDRDLR